MEAGKSGGCGSTRCGVNFFVSVDVLLTFETVKVSHLAGQPGKPEQRMALVNGKAVPVTSYPAASFFLRALKGTNNSLVVVSPWRPEKTESILRLFRWDAFDDIRTVHPEPGLQQLHLSCLDCGVEAYATSVVVTTSRAAWHVSLWPQIVEVRHESGQAAHSLSLLRALSCCLRIAESRIRFPHSAVSSCVALCRSGLFSRCRFYLASEVSEQSSLVVLINEHGGYLVRNYEDATHFVVNKSTDAVSHTLPQLGGLLRDGSRSSSSVSQLSSSFSSDVEYEETGRWANGGSDSKESGLKNTKGHNNRNHDNTNYSCGDDAVSSSGKGGNVRAGTLLAHVTRDATGLSSISPTANGGQSSGPSYSGQRAITDGVVVVTTQWVQDCVDAFIMYPSHVAHNSDESSDWNTTLLLLAVLLPPPDVGPLPLSQFNCIAEDCGFRPLSSSDVVDEGGLETVLRSQWGRALRVEKTGSDLLLSQPPFCSKDLGCEMEQHLAFVAEQFCDAWASVLRDKQLSNTTDSGTQTAVVLTATSGTNTEATPHILHTEGVALTEPLPEGGRALLMRALGPAEWAREIDASHTAHQASRKTDVSFPLEHTTRRVGLRNELSSLATNPPTVGGHKRDGSGSSSSSSRSSSSSSSSSSITRSDSGSDSTDINISYKAKKKKGILLGRRAHGHAVNPPVATTVRGGEEDGDEDYLMCVIPTDSLENAQDTLEKDALLLLPPFRNYPIKLTIDKSGIHCLFVTAVDAKRFCQEGYVEVCNRFLPILPERGDVPPRRKRHRSRSPSSKRLSTGLSRSRRREVSSGDHPSHKHRHISDSKGMDTGEEKIVLSRRDLELLNEIGATYDFALHNVSVIERYALKELADPTFRRQKDRLLHVVSKLKQVRPKTT